jgi:chemotaxis protein MotA
MDLVSFTDATSAAIVLGGTLVATVLRCGFDDCGEAFRSLAATMAKRFNAGEVRSRLAVQVQDIQKNGLLRASPRQFGDLEFDEATDALIGHRSVGALVAAHEAHKARREARAAIAVGTLAQSAELAPVFGLAGTLISLGRLPINGLDRGSYMGAIGMAVHATLYGLIAANLVLAPLARLVERRARREETERQRLVDWLAQVLAPAPVQVSPSRGEKALYREPAGAREPMRGAA